MPRQDPDGPGSGPPKHRSPRARSLGLSLCLLVLLCLPLHITHSLLLFSPGTLPPTWAFPLVSLLSQLYGLVPPLLVTIPTQRVGAEQVPLPHLAPIGGKTVGGALCSAVQAASCSLKGRLCPDVCV